MADIDVVKKGSRSWIWIVLVVILALVAWLAFRGNRPRTVGQLESGRPAIAAALDAPRGELL